MARLCRAACAALLVLAFGVMAPTARADVPAAVKAAALNYYGKGLVLALAAKAENTPEHQAFLDHIAARQSILSFLVPYTKGEIRKFPIADRDRLADAATHYLARRQRLAYADLGAGFAYTAYSVKDGTPLHKLRCARLSLVHAIERAYAADEALDYARRIKALHEGQLEALRKDLAALDQRQAYLERGYTDLGARLLLGIQLPATGNAMPKAKLDSIDRSLKALYAAAKARIDGYRAIGWPDAKCAAYTYVLRDKSNDKVPTLAIDLVQVGTMVVITNVRRDDAEAAKVEARLAALSPGDIDGMVRALTE